MERWLSPVESDRLESGWVANNCPGGSHPSLSAELQVEERSVIASLFMGFPDISGEALWGDLRREWPRGIARGLLPEKRQEDWLVLDGELAVPCTRNPL